MASQTAPRVLFVEDEHAIKLTISELLRDAGFEVIEAANAHEALDLLAEPDEIDVLFTDVRMPGALDGVDLAMHVRRHHPNMPLVIASGYADQIVKRLSGFRPPAVFIKKPYTLEQIVDAITGLIVKH